MAHAGKRCDRKAKQVAGWQQAVRRRDRPLAAPEPRRVALDEIEAADDGPALSNASVLDRRSPLLARQRQRQEVPQAASKSERRLVAKEHAADPLERLDDLRVCVEVPQRALFQFDDHRL